MWIKIRIADGPNLTLPVPLSMLKSRWLWRMIARQIGGEEAHENALAAEGDAGSIVAEGGAGCIITAEGGAESIITADEAETELFDPEMARQAIIELSAFIRRHGHFTLVEVQSADGDHITITV